MAYTKADQRKDFSKKIRKLLNEKAWTQAEAARQVEILLPEDHKFQRDQIGNYVNMRGIPSPRRRETIARAFGVELEYLFPRAMYPEMYDGEDSAILSSGQAKVEQEPPRALSPWQLDARDLSLFVGSDFAVENIGQGRAVITISQEVSVEDALNIIVRAKKN